MIPVAVFVLWTLLSSRQLNGSGLIIGGTGPGETLAVSPENRSFISIEKQVF